MENKKNSRALQITKTQMEKCEVLQIAVAAIQLQQKSLQQIWYKNQSLEEEEAGALDLLLLHTGEVQTLKPEFQSL